MSDQQTDQAFSTPEHKLRAVHSEITELDKCGVLDKAQEVRMEQLLTEHQSLRAQIELRQRAHEALDWGGQSSGMLPLAAGNGGVPPAGQLQSLRSAGATVLEHSTGRDGRGSVRLAEQYGEGLPTDAKTWATISSPEYREAFKSYMRTAMSGALSPTAIRTLQEGSDPSGGFMVPPEILDRIVAKEPTPTRVAGRVTQLNTSRDNLIIPRVNYTTDDNYTTGMRVTWTGEIPASSTTMRVTDPVFGQTHIPVYTAMMSIPITNDMIEDSSFPLVSWVSEKFGETVDLLKDNMILNGSGQGQPAGILLNPGDSGNTQPAVVVSGNASALTADGIIKIAFSLPEQYEDGAVWVMNKTNTLQAVSLLKDSNNRYLYGEGIDQSGLQSPSFMRGSLVGMPIIKSGFMPNVGSSTYPIIFGDLRGYYMVNRVGFSLQVLRELYAETNQILVLGRVRFGGQVVEPWRLKIQQCHT